MRAWLIGADKETFPSTLIQSNMDESINALAEKIESSEQALYPENFGLKKPSVGQERFFGRDSVSFPD